VAGALAATGAPGLAAQQDTTTAGPDWPPTADEVDRIAAIVGDTVILVSDVRQALFRLQAERSIPSVPPEDSPDWRPLARTVVDAMTDRLIAIQEARRLGLAASDAQVEGVADDFYQEVRKQFNSDEQMAQAVQGSGMNMLQYRQMLRAEATGEVMLQLFRQNLGTRTDLPPVIVNESEVEEFFNREVAGQTRPPLVSFVQLILTPFPEGPARDSALERARGVNRELAAGESFEVVARRHSDDEGTRDTGGELGWMRRDQLVREFADAAWAARAGATVGPIQTRFGLHVIKVESARGSERFLRHILIRPEISQADLDRVRGVGLRLADSLRAGVDPERLRQETPEAAPERLRFDDIPIQQLTQQFTGDAVAELATPTDGEVYGPYPIQRGGGPTEFALIHVLRFRPEGPAEIDDFRDRIRTEIRQTKQIDQLLAEIRANTFIDIKL